MMDQTTKGQLIILAGMIIASSALIGWTIQVHSIEAVKRQKIKDVRDYMHAFINTDTYKSMSYQQKMEFLKSVDDATRNL
ncbi:hypothetical protein SEA_TRIBBY_31 [Arthrobacter phage Tribby]|uniref:Uncharacterized protein n=2 Tax=Mudcatvirus TaxID=1982088 RepID=A0A222Z7J8_9CAUD|nr:hypothetical protein PQB75_gp031 [Arthrobacter phage Tribby]ASR80482.1 hypothetical protein SEA_TRIBBY_31 [Arthrobacter phage Tribby]